MADAGAFEMKARDEMNKAARAGFMQVNGFTYMYAVVGGHPLDATRLRNSARFEPVYDSGRITILRLR